MLSLLSHVYLLAVDPLVELLVLPGLLVQPGAPVVQEQQDPARPNTEEICDIIVFPRQLPTMIFGWILAHFCTNFQ